MWQAAAQFAVQDHKPQSEDNSRAHRAELLALASPSLLPALTLALEVAERKELQKAAQQAEAARGNESIRDGYYSRPDMENQAHAENPLAISGVRDVIEAARELTMLRAGYESKMQEHHRSLSPPHIRHHVLSPPNAAAAMHPAAVMCGPHLSFHRQASPMSHEGLHRHAMMMSGRSGSPPPMHAALPMLLQSGSPLRGLPDGRMHSADAAMQAACNSYKFHNGEDRLLFAFCRLNADGMLLIYC